MTILVLCPHFEDTGGVREVVARIAAEHARLGHRVAIITRERRRPPTDAPLPPGSERHSIPLAPAPQWSAGGRPARQFGRRFLRGAPQLVRLLRSVRPDVVAAHCSKFYAPWVMVAAATRQAPIVVHLHNAEQTADGPPSPFWSRRLLGASDHVIAVSDAVADYAHSMRPGLAGHITVVRNGVDPAEAEAAPPEERPLPFVLAVGRLAHQKGLDVLLEALSRLPQPPALVVAGDGPDRDRLQAQADRLGLTSRVEFLGNVPRGRVRALLRGAAVVAMPSRFEGNPLIALEAMQAGSPFVATRIPGLPEELRHEVTGLLVPPEDVGALATAVDRLVRDRPEAAAYGRAAAAAAATMPTWAQVATRVLSVYEGVRRHST